jgi:hypothetical protein
MVDDYDQKQSLRLEHTYKWISQESKFLSWRNNSRRNVELWVRGPPGCGKSTLGTSIIDQLAMDGPTAYFFCNFEDPDRSDLTAIPRTLTWQLVFKKPHLADRVYDIYLETAGATTSVESYKKALTILLKDGEPCYVVIDGLDECRGRYNEIQKASYHISTYAKLLPAFSFFFSSFNNHGSPRFLTSFQIDGSHNITAFPRVPQSRAVILANGPMGQRPDR